MTESPIPVSAGKTSLALDELRAFVDERRRARGPVTDFESFEREARRRFAAAEAEFVAEELVRLDVDASAVEIDGVAHRCVLRCAQTYMTAAGPVTVERTLYSTRQDDERAVCAMELRAGIVEGYFTPLAAANAAWAVAHLTPGESEALFTRMGGMSPSKSTLDRLPKALSERWEADRVGFEQRVRAGEKVPKSAVVVAVSLDGVLVPMKDGRREENYPFANRLYPGSLDAVEHVASFGQTVILTDGDVVFQPRKVERAGCGRHSGDASSYTSTRSKNWTTSPVAIRRTTTC